MRPPHQVALKGLLGAQEWDAGALPKSSSSPNVLPIGTSRMQSNKSRQARPWVMLFIATHTRACSRAHSHTPWKAGSHTLVHILYDSQKRKKQQLLSMVEGFFIPLPNPIMFQFKQMEVYACFSARCCRNKDINSEDGKFEFWGNKVPSREWILRINFSHVWFFTSLISPSSPLSILPFWCCSLLISERECGRSLFYWVRNGGKRWIKKLIDNQQSAM